VAELSSFAGRLRVNGKRMHGTRELAGQYRIYHAVALDPALPFEGVRYNINTEVRLAPGAMAGVALMQT
jgi:hypothetical protein